MTPVPSPSVKLPPTITTKPISLISPVEKSFDNPPQAKPPENGSIKLPVADVDPNSQAALKFIEKYGQQAIINTLTSKPVTNISVADLQDARFKIERIASGQLVINPSGKTEIVMSDGTTKPEIKKPESAQIIVDSQGTVKDLQPQIPEGAHPQTTDEILDEISAKLKTKKAEKLADKQAQMKAAGLDTTQIDVQIKKDQVKQNIKFIDPIVLPPPIDFVKDLSPTPTPQLTEEVKTPPLTEAELKAKAAKENELTADDIEIEKLLGQATAQFDKNRDIIGLFHTILARSAAKGEVMPALVQYMKEKGMPIPANIQPILDKLVQTSQNTESSPLLTAALQSGLMTEEEAGKLNNPDQIGEVYAGVSDKLQEAIKNKDTASAQKFMRTLLKDETFEFNYVGVMKQAGVLPSEKSEIPKKAQKYQEAWEDMQNKTIRERLAKTFAKAGPGLGNSFMFMMILGQLTKMTQEISSTPEQGSGH